MQPSGCRRQKNTPVNKIHPKFRTKPRDTPTTFMSYRYIDLIHQRGQTVADGIYTLFRGDYTPREGIFLGLAAVGSSTTAALLCSRGLVLAVVAC